MGTRLKALTIDFWNTIADGSSGQSQRANRRHRMILETAGLPADTEHVARVAATEKAVVATYEEQRVIHQNATNAHSLLLQIFSELNVTPEDHDVTRLAQIFQHGMDEAPPSLAPNAERVLPQLAREFRLAIISDTLYAPGSVISGYLEARGLRDCFGAFVYSDATGVVKPHPLAFRTALDTLEMDPENAAHIGDLVRTDIKGAKDAGMQAIQYTGIWTDRNSGALPDTLLADWADLPDLLRKRYTF